MRISKRSVALLLIQLAIVSLVAAKYGYERWRAPRVWTRTVAIGQSMPMRGRYLGLRLVVDGCQSTLPSAKAAKFLRDINGSVRPGPYSIGRVPPVEFPAELKVENGRLEALWIEDEEKQAEGQMVEAPEGAGCGDFRLDKPVDFFIPERATDLTRLGRGQELWVEVTLPAKGPPRPMQMAVKDNGEWKPVGE
jgi:hypothetical protein